MTETTLWSVFFAVLLVHWLLPAEPNSPKAQLAANWKNWWERKR